MGTPGSKEIKNWLGGFKECPRPVYMQAIYPDIITLFNCSEPSLEVRVQCALFSGNGTLTIQEVTPHIIISGIPIRGMFDILQACQGLR